jgi:hypothetical protein
MLDLPEDVPVLVHGKLAAKFASSHIDAMLAVAQAYADRSLHAFQAVLMQFPKGFFLLTATSPSRFYCL